MQNKNAYTKSYFKLFLSKIYQKKKENTNIITKHLKKIHHERQIHFSTQSSSNLFFYASHFIKVEVTCFIRKHKVQHSMTLF